MLYCLTVSVWQKWILCSSIFHATPYPYYPINFVYVCEPCCYTLRIKHSNEIDILNLSQNWTCIDIFLNLDVWVWPEFGETDSSAIFPELRYAVDQAFFVCICILHIGITEQSICLSSFCPILLPLQCSTLLYFSSKPYYYYWIPISCNPLTRGNKDIRFSWIS